VSLDLRRHAPATLRNREFILTVLRRVLPPRGVVLEIGSGSGQHAAFFAAALPELTWQPSDADPDARASTTAWCRDLPNVREPLAIDTSDDVWPLATADAVVCINMIHIAPWRACEGLVRGAARVLPAGGVLYLYGPYRVDGAHTAPSNAAFDADLRTRNPAWGVRDLEAVVGVARTCGLAHAETVAMPANNLSVVFRRA
jgi:SAM-dependent methyltransferase